MKQTRPWVHGARAAMGLAVLCSALSSCTRECDCSPPARDEGVIATRATRVEQLDRSASNVVADTASNTASQSTAAAVTIPVDPTLKSQTVPAPEEEVTNGRGKIVGGEDAPAGDYPWIVAVGFRIDDGPVHVRCGGTLIRPDWIVSAAHCKLREGQVAITGRRDLTKTDGQELRIAEVHVHPNYDPETKKESDLVLARLERSAGIDPIAIVAELEEDPGPVEPLHVAGWGKLSEDNPNTPDILQHVEVRISDHDVCKSNYARVYRKVSDTMLCAAEHGKDACSGDSGGPLIRTNPYTGSTKLAGIVSWGLEKKCARQGYPGVYVKLSKFRTWIDQCIADTTRTACT